MPLREYVAQDASDGAAAGTTKKQNDRNTVARQWRPYIRHNRARTQDKLPPSVLRNRRKRVLKLARAHARRRAVRAAARHPPPHARADKSSACRSPAPPTSGEFFGKRDQNIAQDSDSDPSDSSSKGPNSNAHTHHHQRPGTTARSASHATARATARFVASAVAACHTRFQASASVRSAARDALHRRAEPSTRPRTEAHARSYDHDSDDDTGVWCSRAPMDPITDADASADTRADTPFDAPADPADAHADAHADTHVRPQRAASMRSAARDASRAEPSTCPRMETPTTDAHTDARTDAHDAHTDANTDSSTDAHTDTSTDARADAPADAPADARAGACADVRSHKTGRRRAFIGGLHRGPPTGYLAGTCDGEREMGNEGTRERVDAHADVRTGACTDARTGARTGACADACPGACAGACADPRAANAHARPRSFLSARTAENASPATTSLSSPLPSLNAADAVQATDPEDATQPRFKRPGVTASQRPRRQKNVSGN